jgi:hypothetical protein
MSDEQYSPLEMSDEEFLEKQHEIPDEVEEQEEATETTQVNDDAQSGEEKENKEDSQNEPSESQESDTTEQETDAENADDASDSGDAEEPVISELSKEEQLGLIYGGFKANGKDMHVDNPQDVIRLMQMGAGYTKKMQTLAPKMKVLAMLEQNKLMDIDALNQLIGLSKKDPEAIAAYLRDADIDPLDLDMEGATNFQQTNYEVPDEQVVLQGVLDDISTSVKYKETVDTVSSWDDKSQQDVVNNPEFLRVINGHMESGIYDQIAQIIDNEVTLGKMPQNVPFLDAYRTVGERLEKAGAFNVQNVTATHTNAEATQQPNVDSNRTATQEKRTTQRREAASPTKSTTSKKSSKTTEVSPLEMSDEDFLKQFGSEEWALG